MKRASRSIPANLAEGWSKRIHEKEFKQHINVCIGSSNEMEVHFESAKDFGYLGSQVSTSFISKYNRLGAQLEMLRRNWRTF